MGHGFASTVGSFNDTDEDTLIGGLTQGVFGTGIAEINRDQDKAWRDEIRLLKNQLSRPAFDNWFIILEYEIPRRSRRPDVVLLVNDLIFVVEFKGGSSPWNSTSRWQSTSYALDLRDFHAESYGRTIVPILCATNPVEDLHFDILPNQGGPGVVDLIRATGNNLGTTLMSCLGQLSGKSRNPLDYQAWLNSSYRPTLSIIEAALRIYEGNDVREISHRHAHNLDQTTDMLIREIEDARRKKHRVVCFVTGIPGAGKTLTGLEVVHDSRLRQHAVMSGIFLSGNRPLVNVIQAALVRKRMDLGHNKQEIEREIKTHIQNVHQFIRDHEKGSGIKPFENIVVFDEAQRAWDSLQMKRKQEVEESEAALLLGVMERLPDWAVVIALVGGGQEIYQGEAGLGEWGMAIASRPMPWKVVASPEALHGGNSLTGQRLFSREIPSEVTVVEEPIAHLDVVVRNHRAQRWAEWANELLSLRLERAREIFPETREFPCFLTRNLEHARAWLRMNHGLDPDQRTGLIATSEDQRFRAHGIERSSGFRRGYRFENWFLDPATDTRSSYLLEVAASEFECQGLELDCVGMCWGGDLTPSGDYSTWDYRKFRGAGWQNVRKEDERAYTVNRYRVLLTRARNGLVIWVPEGDSKDPTRDPERFDRVYSVLLQAGVPVLEENFDAESLQLEPSSSV